MKLGVITKPNEKGQIVIPKEMRRVLGNADNYLKVLEKTRGAWGKAKTIGEKPRTRPLPPRPLLTAPFYTP